MNPQPPDLFPQRPVRSDFARAPSYRMRRVITILVAVALLAAVVHFALGWPSFPHSGEIATIKAEGAWKQKPEQPGGLDIPNQNVQVYQALDNKDGATPPVEHLLPPPETPLPVVSGANNAPVPSLVSPPPQVETLTPPKLDIDTITPTASPPDAPVAPPESAPAPAAAPPAPVAVASPPPANPAPAPSPPAKVPVIAKARPKTMTIDQVMQDVASVPKTSRVVQLASVQDQASAQAMANDLQNRYSSILGSAQLRVVEANIAGKGTYYRIQSQPLPNDRAGGICDALKKMKAGCILVRP